ncbi:uncharacterized protein LOC119388042 isoform X2 [Rhipicephalus sanguineus]|uniref:uncharacterized protein LOC119388042 isoform X2 n=1 Tax=Rhipicephalus sanguineus TaxID=34632 RepID=UPI0020C39D48|nr:uncharacterized protein LOC119388042 isoform X2 [Rhipicephalus sanguineus]
MPLGEDPATPGNIDASVNPLASEREDVPPEELESYGGVGYSFEGQDELFPTGDEEPEEPEDSPANDGLLEATSERLGSRVRGMVEKAGEDSRNVFQKSENLVLRATALRHDVLQHNDQQTQKFNIVKNMLLDSLKKYSNDGE